jgi:hypothetical protein
MRNCKNISKQVLIDGFASRKCIAHARNYTFLVPRNRKFLINGKSAVEELTNPTD